MKLKAAILLILLTMPLQAAARPIITDLSERKIAIDANFTGKEILVYGARVEAGQIVIVIRGPEGKFMVRKKERVAGMWVNTGSVKFYNIPQFYVISSSKALDKLDSDTLLKNLEIGLDKKDFGSKTKLKPEEVREYRQALLAKLEKDNLLSFDVINLPFLEGTLFRFRINFPEKVLPGIYTAEIYSFNEGNLVGMQSIPVVVEKVGLEATIHNFAHNYPAWYGLFAIFFAAAIGWAAGSLFKKV